MRLRELFATLAYALASFATASYAQTLEQTAGIYYAYPQPSVSLTAAPDGYQPFYISHYGRHGSRWVTDDFRYLAVTNTIDSIGDLTPLGKDVRARLELINNDALGRSGSLSPVGARQHHQIGSRMIEHYPEVFTDTSKVNVVSSTSVRCVMSMCAFTEALKERNPKIDITRTAYEKDMGYIAYTTPEGKRFSANDADWRKDYWQYVYKNVRPDRLIASLFNNPERISDDVKFSLVTGLYWIASDMQDVDLDETLYDIFTYEELRDMWRCINARMYICNGDAPIAGGVMMHCADNLLNDVITCADNAIATGSVSANLRFGHDTHLLRLLALMGITDAIGQANEIENIHEEWQDYRLSPMAANLQLIFYHNADGDILVKALLNEREVSFAMSGEAGPYYSWPKLREYLMDRLSAR